MGFVAALVPIFLAGAAGLGLSFLAKALRKPKSDTGSLDFEQIINRRLQSGLPTEVLFGRRIVAGVGVFDDSYDTKRERAVQISIFSAKPCTDFHGLYLDGELMTLGGDPRTGEVDITSHFLGKPTTAGDPLTGPPRARFRLWMGDNNGALGAYLAAKFPGKFSAGDNFGDYCVGVLECHNTNDDFDEDEGTNFIPFQGFPDVKVELSGARICDPGAGGDYADETSYVYSDNPALIEAQLDYGIYSGAPGFEALIVGNGYPVEFLDIAQIIANRDFCAAAGFGCSGVVRSGSQDDLAEVRKCFNADRVEEAAKVYSVPEASRTFAETIDLSDYPAARVVSYDRQGFSTEVFNEIITSYAEPQEQYGAKELPAFSDPAWIAADNHVPRQMSLPLLFVTDQTQAARLQKQEVYQSRAAGTISVDGLPFGYTRLKRGDLVTLTGTNLTGVDGTTWIIDQKGNDQAGTAVLLALREYAGVNAFDFDPGVDVPPIIITLPTPRQWPFWQPPLTVGHSTVAGIIGGTVALADVTISGVGSIRDTQLAQNSNIANNATSGGGLAATVTPGFVTIFTPNTGTATTNTATITVTGGSGSETITYNHISGDVFTVDSPGSFATTFSINLTVASSSKTAVYEAEINDGGTIVKVQFNVSAYYDNGF